MTRPPGRVRVAIAPVTAASVTAVLAAAGVLLLPPDWLLALLVGWVVGAFTFIVIRAK